MEQTNYLLYWKLLNEYLLKEDSGKYDQEYIRTRIRVNCHACISVCNLYMRAHPDCTITPRYIAMCMWFLSTHPIN